MTNIIKFDEQKQKLNVFKELAQAAIKSGSYGNMTIETATNLMLSAADLGVSPMKALNGAFHIVKGKIVMAGHLISDRIRSAGHSIKVTEHTREKCVIIGVRKDNGDSYKSEFDVEDAKMAGLLGSDAWKKYPKDMLYNRAISRLGRVLFSDVVGACYSEDEKHDIEGIKPEDRPAHDPDDSNTIEVPPAVLDQTEAIATLIGNDEVIREKVLKWQQVDCITKIEPANHEKVIKAINNHKAKEGVA